MPAVPSVTEAARASFPAMLFYAFRHFPVTHEHYFHDQAPNILAMIARAFNASDNSASISATVAVVFGFNIFTPPYCA